MEYAHSTLIGKLIALENWELAREELYILKSRITDVLGLDKSANAKVDKEKDLYVDLLVWTSIPDDISALHLIIACQLNALRLVSAARKTDVTEVYSS